MAVLPEKPFLNKKSKSTMTPFAFPLPLRQELNVANAFFFEAGGA
jgi:hypothetical protein